MGIVQSKKIKVIPIEVKRSIITISDSQLLHNILHDKELAQRLLQFSKHYHTEENIEFLIDFHSFKRSIILNFRIDSNQIIYRNRIIKYIFKRI